MGCFSNRRKQTAGFTDQKWHHIHLNDFKAKGVGSPLAYGYLWFSLVISIAVYSIDSFTAVQLLAFDRWSSEIKPVIGFTASKWIFSCCILLSFVNLAYEGWRAVRVMKRGNVAECFLDTLAVRWESIRVGNGQGWRRFLVFAELTKSKKGAEYIAIFTYFNLKAWIRVILCSGPRQVVNALTLRSVYVAKLADTDSDNIGESILGFFDNIKTLASENYRQAVILSGMCFTLVIWIFSALFLIAAVLFYVFFLFHWIPRSDGGLTGYCERKVNKAVLKVVTKKVNKALAKEENNRIKAELKAAKRTGEKPQLNRIGTGTLPTLPNVAPPQGDSLTNKPMLGRKETSATLPTLPAYESRPSTPANIELDNMDGRRHPMTRTGTMGSTSNFSAHAPLVGGAADMGYGGNEPQPTLPNIDFAGLPPRPGTSNSSRSFAAPPAHGHMNSNSMSSLRTPMCETPAPMGDDAMPPFPPPGRAPSARPTEHATNYDGWSGAQPPARQYDAYNPDGRSSPAPSYHQYRGGPPSRDVRGQAPDNQQRYPPTRSATGPVPYNDHHFASERDMSASVPPRGPATPAQRNNTASPMPNAPLRTPQPPMPRNLMPRNNTMSPMQPSGNRQPPHRNMTAPAPARGPPPNDYYGGSPAWQDPRGPPQYSRNQDRSGTPVNSHRGDYGYDIESQRDRGY